MKPVIGITCAYEWVTRRFRLGGAYVEAVTRSGGLPIILPSISPGDVDEVLDLIDGLMLSGGVDIDPYLYGEKPIPGMGKIDPNRDAFELALTRRAIERGIPILAICRGIQTLNVAAGGTLYQDILSQIPNAIKHRWHTSEGLEVPPDYPTHRVKVKVGSRLHRIFGKEVLAVNSFHHQAVKDVAEGFEATAWADDGVIEAIEYTGECFILGVQWHPELMINGEMIKLFQEFIRQAAIKAKR